MAYYLGLKPSEFWNSRYREIYIFCEMNIIRIKEDFKQEIILQEAVTNKLIQADCLNPKAKVIPLGKTFKELFDKEK